MKRFDAEPAENDAHLFGLTWGELYSPTVQGEIEAIDEDDAGQTMLEVGLSGKGISNLGILARVGYPLRRKALDKHLESIQGRVADRRDFGSVWVTFGDQTEQALVYCAVGENAPKGNHVRMNKLLADRFTGIKVGETISITREDAVPQAVAA